MKLEKNWLEWAVFVFSLALTCGVAGFLVRDSYVSRQPAHLAITLGETQRAGRVWRVPVRVENKGDVTASAVVIEVLRDGSDEAGELDFDFVPRRSYREGWVSFSGAPKGLEARVRGYQEP